MKPKRHNLIPALALLALSTLTVPLSTARAQNTVFTYQGRVTDSGTNFDGAGQFKFALVTSTNANHTATAAANAPSGGYITGYNLITGGNGYTGSTAAMTITGGGGSGAAAHANISGGTVVGFTIDNPGNGLYTSAPTVTIAPPPANINYTTYWSNDGTSVAGSEPTAEVNVNVNSGLFTVVLGDTTLPNMAAIDAGVFSQPDLQLRIWFSDGVHGFAVMDPAQPLTPAPCAVQAESANGLPGLTVQHNVYGAPNVIGGSSVNFVTVNVWGATIGGGGATDYFGTPFTNSVTGILGTVSGGGDNTASYFATVGGGANNTASGGVATVSGGNINTASGEYAVVGGGYHNTADNNSGTVGGGQYNTASGFDATVSGGGANQATNSYATVPGGAYNIASGQFSFAAGRQAQATNDGAFVWADSQNAVFTSTNNDSFNVRAQGGVRYVTGGAGLTVDGQPVLTRSGVNVSLLTGIILPANLPNGLGGSGNNASGSYATVGGGYQNTVSGDFATIVGGQQNTATSGEAVVVGGNSNHAIGDTATVGGGGYNTASGDRSTIGGGTGNSATNTYATVPGGANNLAGGQYSFAAGRNAQALQQGAFVWADSQGSTFSSTANNQFLVRAAGGVGINTTTPGGTLSINTGGAGTVTVRNDGIVPALVVTNGNAYSGYLRFRNHLEIQPNDAGTASGYLDVRNMSGNATITLDGQSGAITATAFNVSSDRNVKEDFAPVSSQTVLAKVAALPITEWNYKTDAAGQKHLGPMAQDFHAAFGLNGKDDKHISVIDEGGVALAAIQGLNQKLEQKQTEITELKRQNDSLATRLTKLEQLVTAKIGGAQ